MSEHVEQINTGEPVSEDDLRKMLDDLNGRLSTTERERDQERQSRQSVERERDDERAARLLTEQERDGHAARVGTEAEQRFNLEKESVRTGIETQKAIVENAEQAYARHAEVGDWTEAAKAQRQMAAAEARIASLENKQEFLDTNKDRLIAPPKVERREPVQAAGKYAQFIGGRIEPAEVSWLDARPNFIADPVYRNKVFGASQMASSEHVRGTPAYFREMERILGDGQQRQEDTRDNRDNRDNVRDRGPSSDLAPQRRSTPGQDPNGGRFSLTAEEREVADSLYGNPNGMDYMPEASERYRRYHDNKQKRRDQNRA